MAQYLHMDFLLFWPIVDMYTYHRFWRETYWRKRYDWNVECLVDHGIVVVVALAVLVSAALTVVAVAGVRLCCCCFGIWR